MFDLTKAQLEIEDRNRLRVEANLPPVAVVAELRRLYEVQRQTDFEQFFQTAPIRKRVEEKLLTRIRSYGDPQWVLPDFLSERRICFLRPDQTVMARLWRTQRRKG